MNPWQVLGIAQTQDTRAIKQAYARALKQTRPDSDPEGYQRLRECYEWALGWVEWRQSQPLDPDPQASIASESVEAPVPDVDDEADTVRRGAATIELARIPSAPVEPALQPGSMPHAAAPAAQTSDGPGETRSDAAPVLIPDSEPAQEPAPIEIVEPAPLLASLHQYWTQQGDAALIDALPRLLFALNEVPLAYQAEASHRFAAWLVENPVPEEVAAVLQRHFGWRSDYRVDAQLGPELGEALRAKLAELGLDGAPGTRAAVQRALFGELRRLVEQRLHWRACWRLLREPGRSVLRLDQELEQLTSGRPQINPTHTLMKQAVSKGNAVLLGLAATVLAGLAVLFSGSDAAGLGLGLVFLFAAFPLVMLAHWFAIGMDLLYARLGRLAPAGPRLPYWRLLAALVLCAAAVYWGGLLPQPWLLLPLSLPVLQLLWWPGGRWNLLLLPLALQFALLLGPLLPEHWPAAASWWVALAWVGVSHFGLLRSGSYPQFYRDARALLPKRALEVVWYLIAFKVVLSVFALGYLLLLPTTHLVQSLRESPQRLAVWSLLTSALMLLTRAEPVLVLLVAIASPLVFLLLVRSVVAVAARLPAGLPRSR